MDEELEQKLIDTVRKDVSNYLDSGYKIIGNISKQRFNKYEGVASVFVAFKKDPLNFTEQPLEKYFRYRLRNNDYDYSWHYMDSDG